MQTEINNLKLAEQRNLKNELIVKNIQELKEQGIL